MDWDKDGVLDILSGCYWTEDAQAGQIQFLKGKGPLEFAESVSLTNAEGKPLENVKLESDDSDEQTDVICTEQHAVDLDGDGDLDLVVGCFGEKFFYYENQAGPDGKPALAEPIKMSVSSPDYHSAPHLVDWDGDGDLDLLSGAAGGGVLLSVNSGTKNEPKFEEFKALVEASKSREFSDGQEITLSQSTRVWVTDFNRDGLLDLLVGDSVDISRKVEGLSEEEYLEKKAAFDKGMGEIAKKQRALLEKFGGEYPETFDEETQEKMEALSNEMMEIYESKSEFDASQSTGFVWLLLQKKSD